MSFESQLRGLLDSIKNASFNKGDLEQFKRIPKTLRPAYSSNDDDIKLAAEVYGSLVAKLLSFSKEIKEGRITPNDEGLGLCEELVDTVDEENKFLIASFPRIATEGKLDEVQRLLPGIKTAIQQKRNKTLQKSGDGGKPSNSLGTTIVVVLAICGFAFLVFVGVKVFQRQRHR